MKRGSKIIWWMERALVALVGFLQSLDSRLNERVKEVVEELGQCT